MGNGFKSAGAIESGETLSRTEKSLFGDQVLELKARLDEMKAHRAALYMDPQVQKLRFLNQEIRTLKRQVAFAKTALAQPGLFDEPLTK